MPVTRREGFDCVNRALAPLIALTQLTGGGATEIFNDSGLIVLSRENQCELVSSNATRGEHRDIFSALHTLYLIVVHVLAAIGACLLWRMNTGRRLASESHDAVSDDSPEEASGDDDRKWWTAEDLLKRFKCDDISGEHSLQNKFDFICIGEYV